MLPQREPAPVLLVYQDRAKPRSYPLVVGDRQHLGGSQGFHDTVSLGASAGATGFGNPSGSYARARTSIGCIGRVPKACSNCTAASGQSVVITDGSASFIAEKARSPHFKESSKYSFFIAQVPSCDVHASTVTISEPGIWRIRSRDRGPIPCAFR